VMVVRHDQIRVQEALHGWEWWAGGHPAPVAARGAPAGRGPQCLVPSRAR
jgi:hypothetical protein